jgi:hypothetical protein
VKGPRVAAAFGLVTAMSAAWSSEVVAAVHPSGASVAENLLRIELRLQAPLRAPLDMTRVTLLDEAGRVIPDPFLDLALPSADGRRIAVLLHPGRVKTGVGANLRLGRALHAGTTVTLVIDDPSIGQVLRKTWKVLPAESAGPAPSRWILGRPVAGSRQALVVRMQSPISASSESLIAVKGPDGHRARGSTRLSEGDTVWTFTPAQPWPRGMHRLVTHPDLETPAGNRTCARFETLAASSIACESGAEIAFEVLR